MKTVQSFFPTTTKSKASFRKQVTYKVMKKVQNDTNLQTQQLQKTSNLIQQKPIASTKTQNIFRDKQNSVKNYSIDQNNQRPIGGLDLFKRMEKANHLGIEESTRRISKKGSKKNIFIPNYKNNFSPPRNNPQVNVIGKQDLASNLKEEMFKEHSDCKEKYTIHMTQKRQISKPIMGNFMSQPQTTVNGRSSTRKYSASEMKHRSSTTRKFSQDARQLRRSLLPQSAKSSSVQSLSHAAEKQKQQLRWASQQQKNYLDKMAILNEINYNKPLIQKLGNKYFECVLRNRYMDEPEYNHKSPYIYQIKDKMADTKFISKIKSMKYNFMERNKIVVKGRSKLNKEQDDKAEQRQGKKRWDQWNEDQFDD